MFQGLLLFCMVAVEGIQAQSNSSTRIWPSLEDAGINVSVDKPLYFAGDTMEYGKTSAMMRFYYVNAISGHRFPVNLGVGTFGVNSPIDVGVGQGGFAASIFLDVVELIRKFGVHFDMKVNAAWN